MKGIRAFLRAEWPLLAALWAGTAVLHSLAAWPLQVPGYMDACYYYEGARALYRGQGFWENFLWNYLDDPAGLPHPSHLYWMPLPSVWMYLAFLVMGPGLRTAQAANVLLSAFLPPLAYALARTSGGERWQGLLAAGLTAFSGFYLVYWPAPDGFALFGVVGALCLVALARGVAQPGPWSFALAGALGGLAHLTRADGLLLALLAVALPWWAYRREARGQAGGWRGAALAAGLALGAYFLVMAPWFVRNVQVIGRPLPAGGLRTLFLRHYDDLFAYGREIGLEGYLAWGWGNILRSKAAALWTNAQTVVAVWLQVFAAPLAAWGCWRWRREAWVRVSLLYGGLLYLAMSLGFSAPGPRGALLHSGTALLPFLHAAVGPGLEAAVGWARRSRRHWQPDVACRVFAGGLLALSALVSGALYARAVWGGGSLPPWNERDALYPQVEAWLAEHAAPDAPLMVVNPPCYTYFSGRPTVAIPNELVEVVLTVADRYGARYLLLEANHPRPLEGLYQGREVHPRLRPLHRWGDAVLFAVEGGP
ncbi:MAG: hypothetical protein H5T59_00690 [Anaerolineae bacterium]|nr:hypothetical protein [Anaerolineae bacterium]